MKYFRILILSLCCLGVNVSFAAATESAVEIQPSAEMVNPTWQEVVEYARENLPQQGRLVAASDGFVYLKVDDAYIHTLFPMLGLAEEGYKEPPYFRTSSAPGAHISVFYVNEHIIPEEAGEVFHFELQQIVIVHAGKDAAYAVLQVESPELEALRQKYGLSPKLFGHEYHISLAKKTIRRK